MTLKKYVIDIDGTICYKNSDDDYDKSVPIAQRINKINNLFDSGNTIIYFTARGMGRFDDNASLARAHFEELTFSQLKQWGCKFHQLILGKPSGDFYIDDKGINDKNFFIE